MKERRSKSRAWNAAVAKATGADAPDPVNHPSHYGGDTVYETIKVIKAWGLGFSLGNAIKYISRAGKKDPSKLLEDLKKARFYLDDEIATAEGHEAAAPKKEPAR